MRHNQDIRDLMSKKEYIITRLQMKWELIELHFLVGCKKKCLRKEKIQFVRQ